MRGRAAVAIALNDDERSELEMRARRRKTARADAQRAAIVLLAAAGESNTAIAARLRVTRVTVTTWRNRFARRRLEGLSDEPRPGAPRKIGDDKIADVVTATLESMPPGATHWSRRSMARASGLSVTTVHRIWSAFSLQPQRSETFKLSTDPLFVAKIRDIVGLYLDPPDRALVLCIDEKSQIQALDRTQPLLPMRPGQPSGIRTITSGTASPRCLPHSTSPPATSLANVCRGTAPGNFDVSSTLSSGTFPMISTSMSSSTRLGPQDKADPQLVRQATALARPFHANVRVLGQSGGAVLRPAD